MINQFSLNIKYLSINFVGNKALEEGVFQSKHLVDHIDQFTKESLIKYFIEPFKMEEFYHFQHSSAINLNEVFSYAARIFESPKQLLKVAHDLAGFLYEKTTHPNIKSGEFYVCYFENLQLDDKVMDAIGLFKSESKDTFLKVFSDEQDYHIETHSGISIKKLDKGCLIFNTSKNEGYKVCVIDSTNKSVEAQYWKNDFLNLKQISDSYNFTRNFLTVTKNFIAEQLDDEFEIDKTAKIALLNRSVDYFKENETFQVKDFEKNVFEDADMIESFRKFGSAYLDNNNIAIADSFEISDQAVKKQVRIFKSVLKLDKNFHIYIHGPNELIERGVEKDGRKYYKIYFNNEA
ncbi:nucleoid-associated protein [soil metagenome]